MNPLARRPNAIGRQALSLYDGAPRTERVHVGVRWWSAPFRQIEAALPKTGRILEIGCGHGLFCAYAALSCEGRQLHGTDIDAAKISHAQRAAQALPGRLSFAVAQSGQIPPGPWDAIVIIDVLYLLTADEQHRLLADALKQLRPGGRLLVKEMATKPVWKVRWNQFQETLAVKVLRITEGRELTFVPSEELASGLVQLGADTKLKRLDKGRMHAHQLLIAQLKPQDSSTAPSSYPESA
ncbi:MAG: class I SAM-dependent methyltransferase [Antricoccus sp.]